MINERKLIIPRILCLILGWIAVVMILTSKGDSKTTYSYLMYYTIQSNILVLLSLSASFLLSLIKNKKSSFFFIVHPAVRGALSVYIAITFFGFAIFLQKSGSGLSFTNFMVHYITPIYFLFDAIVSIPRRTLKWKYIGPWYIYPAGYLILTIIYGSETGFYAYYFLDYSKLGPSVFLIAVLILAAVFGGFSSAVIGINKVRRKTEQKEQV